MGAHHRVRALDCLGVEALAHAAVIGEVALGLSRCVHRVQRIEHLPHAVGERLVGEVHVGEHRVTANPRELTRIQHRAPWRSFQEGEVGVPSRTEIPRLVRLLHNLDDVRMSRKSVYVGVRFERTEAFGERAVLLRRQFLVAEEDHEVVVQRGADCLENLVGQRTGEVHTVDLCAERAGDRLDTQGRAGHCSLLLSEPTVLARITNAINRTRGPAVSAMVTSIITRSNRRNLSHGSNRTGAGADVCAVRFRTVRFVTAGRGAADAAVRKLVGPGGRYACGSRSAVIVPGTESVHHPRPHRPEVAGGNVAQANAIAADAP